METIFPEERNIEWHYEVQAKESCFDYCIEIIENNTNLESFTVELDKVLDSYKAELYYGFLSSAEDFISVNTKHNELKDFKEKIKQIAIEDV